MINCEYGGCSSAVRTSGCDPGCHGFESHQAPQVFYTSNQLPMTPEEYLKQWLTSPSLSKRLFENGFEEETLCWYSRRKGEDEWDICYHAPLWDESDREQYPAYDLLNELCARYAKKIFVKDSVHDIACKNCLYEIDRTDHILHLLQSGKKEEAEEYLWKHCIFSEGDDALQFLT